ncbi:hypothetical protein FPE67_10595 [Salmonella enterica subsp. enterica]|nr:hypothetical protein [Salmonella enterica subsp. enterica serovar Agona]
MGAPPVLARIQSNHATALKPTHKAGRRGGESIARQRWCVILKIIVCARRDGAFVVAVGSFVVGCGCARVERLRRDDGGV